MIIDKNLVKFLQFRDTVLDISDLEKKYKRKLPPIFKAFITVFEPHLAPIGFKHSKVEGFNSFVYPIYPEEEKDYYDRDDDSLSLEGFLDPETILKFEAEYAGWEGDVLYIAKHSYHGGLMVGIKEHNADKIFHSSTTMEIDYIAENIFEFLQKMQLVKEEHYLPEFTIDTNTLYRNWHENFWRIRGDEGEVV